MKTQDELTGLTNKELMEEASKEGIVKFPNAMNPSKPNKSEIIGLILDNRELDKEKELADLVEVKPMISNIEMGTVTKPKPRPKEMSDSAIARMSRDIAFMKVKVRVSESARSLAYTIDQEHSSDDDNHQKVQRVIWGNDLIGHQIENIIFDNPIYIRRGCLTNLEKAKSIVTVKRRGVFVDEEFPTYSVAVLPAETAEEIEELKKVQRFLDQQKANHAI